MAGGRDGTKAPRPSSVRSAVRRPAAARAAGRISACRRDGVATLPNRARLMPPGRDVIRSVRRSRGVGEQRIPPCVQQFQGTQPRGARGSSSSESDRVGRPLGRPPLADVARVKGGRRCARHGGRTHAPAHRDVERNQHVRDGRRAPSITGAHGAPAAGARAGTSVVMKASTRRRAKRTRHLDPGASRPLLRAVQPDRLAIAARPDVCIPDPGL